MARALDGIQHKAVQHLENQAQQRRASYQDNVDLTPEQVQAEGAYIAGLNLTKNSDEPVSPRAKQAFETLPQAKQEALRKATYANPVVQDQMNSFFGKNQPSQASATVAEQPTVTELPKVKTATPKNTPLTPEQVTALGQEDEGSPWEFNEFNGKPVSISSYKGKNTFKIEDSTYELTPEQQARFDTAVEEDNSEEQQKVFQEILDSHIQAHNQAEANKTSAYQVRDTDGSTIAVSVTDSQYAVSGKGLRDLPQSAKEILQNPESTQEQKNQVIIELARSAESLDPEVLQKQNKYFEEGEVKEYDSEEVKNNFKEMFSDGLAKLFIPVKRAIHLWTSDNPRQFFLDTLGAPDKILNYLRENHFTNANSLYLSLIEGNPTQNHNVIDKTTALIEQIISAVNPKGVFQKSFDKNLDLDNVPYLTDPAVKEKVKQISGIAAAQWVATLSAYHHNLNQEELAKFFPDLDVEDAAMSLDGVIEPMALQNLVATLRKFLGVNYSNDVSRNEAEAFLAPLAVEVAKSLMKSGIIARQEAVFNVPGIKMDRPINEFVPTKDYQRLFAPKADILTSLLDPNFKNTWSTTPLSAKRTIAHSSVKTTQAQRETIEALNSKPASINTYLVNTVDLLGGEWNLDELIHGTPATEENRAFYTIRNWISKRGQQLSRRLGYDFLNEVRTAHRDVSLKDVPLYFSYVALKNGRFMMEGAATYQSNKVVRQFVNFLNNKEQDLTNEDLNRAWKLTLAQKLGIKVNNKPFEDYKEDIDEALDFINDLSHGRLTEELQNQKDEAQKQLKLINSWIEIKDKNPRANKSLDAQIIQWFRDNTKEGKNGLYDNWYFVGYPQYFKEALGQQKERLEKIINQKAPKLNFDFVQDLMSAETKGITLDVSREQAAQNKKALKYLIEQFNQKFENRSLAITDEESFNALVEMLRYTHSNEEQLKHFDSRIFLEIDGINDGPSNINSLFSLAMSSFGIPFLVNSAKTGNFVGLDTTSQEALKKGTEATEVTQINGADFHAEVAQKKITNYVLQRLVELNKMIESANPRIKRAGQLGIESLRQVLKLLKYTGFIDGNIEAISLIKSMPKEDEYPFTFARDISKKLVTIIPYGSEARGSTQQIVSLMVDAIYEHISGQLAKVADGTIEESEKRQFNSVMKALQSLFNTDFENGAYTKRSSNAPANFMESFQEILPSEDDVLDTHWTLQSTAGKWIYKENGKINKDKTDIRNFYITQAGLDHLTKLMLPLIGEPAQAAVNEVLGPSGMKGARIPTAIAGLLNTLAQSAEQLIRSEYQGDLNNQTGTEAYKNQARVQRVSPTFETSSKGSKVVVKKTKFVTNQKPLYQDKETGIAYYPSDAYIDSASVSGGPLIVQGAGDASMVVNLMNLSKDLLNLGQVYDGVYLSVDKIDQAGQLANQASTQAQKQKVIANILDRMDQVGRQLIKEKWSNKTDPREAIIDCLANIAEGKLLNGKEVTDDSYKVANAQRSILNYLEKFNAENVFEPKMIKERAGKLSGVSVYGDPAQLRGNLEDRLHDFFTQLDAIRMNEEINHRVVNLIPRTTHHMSASTATYKAGNPLSIENAQNLLKEVNKLLPDHPFGSFFEMEAAYMNYLAQLLFDNEYSKDPKYKKTIPAWLKLTNRLHGNDPIRTELPSEVVDLIESAFNKPISKRLLKINKKSSAVIKPSEDKRTLKEAFNTLAKSNKDKTILSNLYKKIGTTLPNDIQISIFKDLSDLPKEVQQEFTNARQTGLYIVSDGIPKIYIRDLGSKMDISDPKNLTTLVHEAIHASISGTIDQYYKDPSQLTANQREAIKNLESLLKDFMDTTLWDKEASPECIDNLRAILEKKQSPAERLDESLAYIFSNHKLMEAFADYKLKNTVAHVRNFGTLLKNIVQAAKNAWKKLLNIVTGSPMDTVLNENTSLQLLDAKPMDFLSLYGANTLVVLNENQRASKNDRNQKRNRFPEGGKRSSLSLDFAFTHWKSSDLRTKLFSRIQAKTAFDVLAEKASGKDLFLANRASEIYQKTTKEVQEELERIQTFKDSLYKLTKNYVSNADDFVNLLAECLDRDSLTDSQRTKLQQAYQSVINNLDETFLLDDPATSTQEEIDRSKAIYDLMTGHFAPLIRENLDYPKSFHPKWMNAAIFYALATTNQDINEKLGKIKLTSKKPTLQGMNFNKFIEDYGSYLVDKWSQESLQNKNVGSALQVLNPTKGTYKTSSAERLNSFIDSFIRGISYPILKVILLPLRLVKTPIARSIERMFTGENINPLDRYRMLGEIVRSWANRINNPIVTNLFSDLYGRVPSNTEVQTDLKRLKGFTDKQRKDLLENQPKEFTALFKKTHVTPQLRKTLFRTIARTDLSILTLEEAENIFTQPNYLRDQIRMAQNKLIELAPQYAQEYEQKILQLANYLTGDRKSGHLLLTNAVAIARLLGTRNLTYITENDPLVATIDRLVTFYSIRNLAPADISLMSNLYANDQPAVEAVLQHLKEARANEDARVRQYFVSDSRGYQMALHNRVKGWLPKGTDIQEDYRLIPQSELKEYKNRGYTILGRYQASNIDTSEPVYEVVFNYSQANSYQEGLFQSINRTDHGYLVNKVSRGEAIGTKITQRQAVLNIFRNYDKEQTDNGVIPLFDSNGDFAGYERAIPPKSRQYLEGKEDLFSGISQYYSRIERESLADGINEAAIESAYRDWENASDKAKKTEFIDVFHTDNPVIKDAVLRMDKKVRQKIQSLFPEGKFYLRRDNVYSYLGYVEASLTDLWDGKFFLPKKVEQTIAKCLDVVFFGKGKYYTHTFEQLLSSAVSFAKDTIIVRSGVVPFINAVTNIASLMMVLAMDPVTILKMYVENWADTQKYKQQTKLINHLKFQQVNATNEATKKALQKQIDDATAIIENLPIYKLIKEGEYSTISDTGVSYESVDLLKQNADTNINAMIDKFGGKGTTLKKGLSEALMLKGSGTFKFMAEAVNMGDWLAKTTAYRYLTEQKKLTPDVARNIASILFIDYDQFVGRERDWLNRLGVTWFMTFKYRIFSAFVLGMHLNPGRLILGSVLDQYIDFGGTPLTENFFSKLFTGNLDQSVGIGMIFRAFKMHPINVVTGLY